MNFEPWLKSWLRSLSQIALSEAAPAGLLILAATFLVAPFSAVGALVGATVGSIAGRLSSFRDDRAWELGIYGANPAIVGMMWGGPLSRAEADAALFLLALAVTVLVDQVVRSRLYLWGLPALATTAVLIGWGSHWVYQTFDVAFWEQEWLLPFGEVGGYVAVALVILVVAQVSWSACVLGVVLTAAAALVSGAIVGELWGPASLWAFTVAPAVVVPFVFLRPAPRVAARAGLLAAAVATLLWTAWVAMLGGENLPPLLLPCIAGIWIALRIAARPGGAWVMEPQVWTAVDRIVESHARGRRVVVLTGAGISTASKIPDYVSGAWFDPDVPATNYGFDVFKVSRKCRMAYWAACEKFKRVAADAEVNRGHAAIAKLEDLQIISSVITQNVDGLHQKAGSRSVAELHGNIFQQRCVKCHRVSNWDETVAWRDDDPVCGKCGGLTKPAVIAFGEDIPPHVWRKVCEAATDCGVLIVAGTQMTVSTATQLVGIARRGGATIVVINRGNVAQPIHADDLQIYGPTEDVLPAICWLMQERLRRKPDLPHPNREESSQSA